MPVMRFKSAIEALHWAKQHPGAYHVIVVIEHADHYTQRGLTSQEWAQAQTGGFVRFLQRENIVAWHMCNEIESPFTTVSGYVDSENAKLQEQYDRQGTWTGD